MGDIAEITCLNPNCQTPNPETYRFCQQCRTPLPKRYLWAVGEGVEGFKAGKLLAERFAVKTDRIVLDTQPGLPLSPTEEISDWIVPYLRLFPYQLHIPQVYTKLPPLKKGKNKEIWLLEQAPILIEKNSKIAKAQTSALMPELAVVWKDAGAMRQLNWLWQIAQLWQPLCSEGVGTSLLNPKLLRVEGHLVRLLELRLTSESPTLSQLGRFWQQLMTGVNPAIAEFLEQLCQQMIRETLTNSEELVAQLDLGLQGIGRSQTRFYQLITRTDTGPTRQRNEDACYPPPTSTSDEQKTTKWENAKNTSFLNFKATPVEKPTTEAAPLCIVCDGIGGHEGGNVASNIAIQTVQQHLLKLSGNQGFSQSELLMNLEYAVCDANDRISQRNDAEGRSERQRMGTTIVIAKAYDREVYITHIGDSRAYWITRTGCHQITLDDDLASREVRLGYSLYREALQQNGAGSLVQALGMGFSSNLHPSIQRFIVDEDSIFLLCSDGLSDNDLVEQYWETEILPVLEKKIDLATAATKLIEIANTQNGHDNVTVGLLYCQVTDNSYPTKQKQMTWLIPPSKATVQANSEESQPTTSITGNHYSQMKTPLLVPRVSAPKLLPLLLGIIILLGLGGLLAYIWVPAIGRRVDSLLGTNYSNPLRLPSMSSPVVPSRDPAGERQKLNLVKGKLIVIQNPEARNFSLSLRAGAKPPENRSIIGTIPTGSVLQIQNKSLIGQESWLLLKVCKVPQQTPTSAARKTPNLPSAYPLAKPGQVGWIGQAEVESYIQLNSHQDTGVTGECSAAEQPVIPLLEKKPLSP